MPHATLMQHECLLTAHHDFCVTPLQVFLDMHTSLVLRMHNWQMLSLEIILHYSSLHDFQGLFIARCIPASINWEGWGWRSAASTIGRIDAQSFGPSGT